MLLCPSQLESNTFFYQVEFAVSISNGTSSLWELVSPQTLAPMLSKAVFSGNIPSTLGLCMLPTSTLRVK